MRKSTCATAAYRPQLRPLATPPELRTESALLWQLAPWFIGREHHILGETNLGHRPLLERLPLSGSCRDQMVIGEAQAVESREPASLREWWVGRSSEPVQGEQETAGYLPRPDTRFVRVALERARQQQNLWNLQC